MLQVWNIFYWICMEKVRWDWSYIISNDPNVVKECQYIHINFQMKLTMWCANDWCNFLYACSDSSVWSKSCREVNIFFSFNLHCKIPRTGATSTKCFAAVSHTINPFRSNAFFVQRYSWPSPLSSIVMPRCAWCSTFPVFRSKPLNWKIASNVPLRTRSSGIPVTMLLSCPANHITSAVCSASCSSCVETSIAFF